MELRIKAKLMVRGFSNKTLINNRGLVNATIDETITTLVKDLHIKNPQDERRILLRFCNWLYGNLDQEIEKNIIDQYLKDRKTPR